MKQKFKSFPTKIRERNVDLKNRLNCLKFKDKFSSFNFENRPLLLKDITIQENC